MTAPTLLPGAGLAERERELGPVAAGRALLERIRADAPVTRRDHLRILVTLSGGLAAAAAAIKAGIFPRHGEGTAAPLKIADRLRPR